MISLIILPQHSHVDENNSNEWDVEKSGQQAGKQAGKEAAVSKPTNYNHTWSFLHLAFLPWSLPNSSIKV